MKEILLERVENSTSSLDNTPQVSVDQFEQTSNQNRLSSRLDNKNHSVEQLKKVGELNGGQLSTLEVPSQCINIRTQKGKASDAQDEEREEKQDKDILGNLDTKILNSRN